MLFADDSVAAGEAWRIGQALEAGGGVPYFRPPDSVRLAPVAFYNSCTDIVEVVARLRHIVGVRAVENFSPTRLRVT